ncbi:hypothetical protein V5F77_20565 [Xanthobacter sp. DSM 24535]|uniref:hypothetical protein n=1 Tax=Roseixanthobacter psychrophilus TaxID=3119917 RepID=UPI00372ACA72
MLILHIRHHFRARATEWMLSGVMLLWGALLLRPGQAFSQPAYSELARIASEEWWGWICLITGAVRLVALIINGAMRPSPHLRAGLAFLSSYFWFELSLGFLLAGGYGTALAVYPLAFVFDLFNAAMAAGDAGASDRAVIMAKKKVETSHGGGS